MYWLLGTSVRKRWTGPPDCSVPLAQHAMKGQGEPGFLVVTARKSPVMATWDIRSRKRPFELSSPASFTLSDGTQSSIEEGNGSHSQGKTGRSGQPTLTKGMHGLHERAAKDHLRHDATSWMDLVHQLNARTRGPVSGCPVVVVVESTHHWRRLYWLRAPCHAR